MELVNVGMDVLLEAASKAVAVSTPDTSEAVARVIAALPEALALEGDDPLTTTPTTVREVHLKAAAIIREVGWTQFTGQDEQGRVCLYEAVCAASSGFRYEVFRVTALQVLFDRIQREYPWFHAISEWNDSAFGSRHGALRFLEMED